MLDRNVEGLPDEELLRIEIDVLGPFEKRGGNENLHAVLFHGVIAGEGLALEVGVDRHLGAAVSGERRDEVERHDTAAAAGEVQRIRRQCNVHNSSSTSPY